MIRKTKGHDLLFDFDSTNTQRSSLETLIDALETSAKEKDMEITLLEAVAAYQAFSCSWVHIPEPRCQMNWSSPIRHFIWLMALHDDGSFIQASNFTPLLAKLKYFCHLTVLYEGICGLEKEDALR
ncbi:hypothetical protein JVT61DRAFT_6756 [Boletus reticuloceps]|uniref:Uncharacterized protein n=1 Tax=Boletus reticuloceps TaxID=495285 RepID=A0A8I3A861_9AGAM|nr:hypothetical protein JVT61DRAFT_6756 [Boletus reticuloceps]